MISLATSVHVIHLERIISPDKCYMNVIYRTDVKKDIKTVVGCKCVLNTSDIKHLQSMIEWITQKKS